MEKKINDYKEAIMKLGAKTKNIYFFIFFEQICCLLQVFWRVKSNP